MKPAVADIAFRPVAPDFWGRCGAVGGLRPCSVQQMPARQKQIRQCARDVSARSVFGDAAIPYLRESPQPFDHQERMLDFGARLGFGAIARLILLAQRAIDVRFCLREILRARRLAFDCRRLVAVCGVAIHPRLVAVQKIGKNP